MSGSEHIPFLVKISACLVTFLILLFATTVFSADVILTWDRPDDLRVTGYEIFYGFAEKEDFKSSPKEIVTDPEVTSCNIYGLIPGQEYLFAAKSYDKFGNKSAFSKVIFYDVPDMSDYSSNYSKSDISQKDDNSSKEINDKIDDSGDSSNEKHGDGDGGGCFIHSIWLK